MVRKSATDWTHVGIVRKVNGETFDPLEGNTGGDGGVDASSFLSCSFCKSIFFGQLLSQLPDLLLHGDNLVAERPRRLPAEKGADDRDPPTFALPIASLSIRIFASSSGPTGSPRG